MTKKPLDYAAPPPASGREAGPRRMFFLLLPSGILIALVLGWRMFEDGDSRNIGGAMCMLAMFPLALVSFPMAVMEATQRRGLRALASATIWCAILIGGVTASLWAILRFKLLQ